MVLQDHPRLSIGRQCTLLTISRSSWYRPECSESAYNLDIMRSIDELFLGRPYLGSRQMLSRLRRQGYDNIGRKRVRRLMRVMGLRPIYPQPKTTTPHPEHPVFPYLLRGMAIARPNQVWCADITYIPMRRGFMYLVAIMDWYSRKVLAWRLSNTLDADFCIATLEDALEKYGKPEILNTDQGCQFTSIGFVALLQENGIKISMDGKGCWRDNIMIERLWRSLKYELIYLYAYENKTELHSALSGWLQDYNEDRGHSSLDDRTPDEVYYGQPEGSSPLEPFLKTAA